VEEDSAEAAVEETAPKSPAASQHEYRWKVGDRVVLAATQTSVVRRVIDGAPTPEAHTSYSVIVSVEVMDTNDDEYIVEYEVQDATLSIPWATPDEARLIAAGIRGMTHRRGVTVRGDSLAMDSIDPESVTAIVLEITEMLQVPHLPTRTLSRDASWPECLVEFLKKDTDGKEESTCTVLAIDDDTMVLAIAGTEKGNIAPPRLDGYDDHQIVVDVSDSEASCTYEIAFDSPAPSSAKCTGTTRKTGRADGKPFVYETTTERTIAPQ
jgi:hypothetical protein